MKRPAPGLWVGLLFSGALTYPVVAQTANPQADTPRPVSVGQAADLNVLPRLGAGFTTTGTGYESFTRFEGFIPLLQISGSTLTFLEGRLLLDTDARLGGNILLGHRFYSPNDKRIYGGYLSYDNRNTGNSVFNQVGAGFESLGDRWDFRVNGYAPLGDSRQMVNERVLDTGLQLTGNPFFQDHFLVAQGQRQFQQIRHFEAAMAGFDVEAGARLAKLGSQGDLRGYGGLYYYNASGSNDALGWRLRLEARPTDALNLGLSVQNDAIFGTNVVLSVGATFPGTRPRGVSKQESVLARMGESVVRTASIVVDSQTESKSFSEPVTVKASNPETGSPYLFQQVKLGVAEGNGTLENPFGTVQAALNATQSDGNDIVYVQAGTNPGIPAFTIPSRVQVLSTGPMQALNTIEFGRVQLPLSGTGVLPSVTDTVTMGNDSVLSGFAIASVTGSGVAARNITNAEIRDNTIASSTVAGVLLENTTGTLTLTNNAIAGNGVPSLVGTNINNVAILSSPLTSINSATDGISLNGVSGNVAISDSPMIITNPTGNGISAENVSGTLTLTGNNGSQISKTGNFGVTLSNSTGAIALSGFEITDAGNSGIFGTNLSTVRLRDNHISNSTRRGIDLDNVNGTGIIANNTITNSGLEGIFVQAAGNTQQAIAINHNSISRSGNPGIFIQASEDAQQQLSLNDNTISDSTGQGIFAQASGTVQQNLSINNSTINNTITDSQGNAGQGLFAQASGTTQQNLSINNSTVSDSAAQGIFVQANNDAQQTFKINNSEVSNSRGQGILAQAAGNILQEINIDNSTINRTLADSQGNGGQGIFVQANQGVKQNLSINNSTINNSAGQGIFLQANDAQQQNFAIDSTTVSNSTVQGVSVQASGKTLQEFSIKNSTIDNTNADRQGSAGQGIFVQANQGGEQTFTIDKTTVIDSAGQGIFVQANDAQQQNFAIDNTTVSNSSVQGIYVQASSNTLQDFSIKNSTINNTSADSQGNAGQGIFVQANQGVQQKFTLEKNVVSDSAGQGIFVQANAAQQQNFTINNSTVSNSKGQGVLVQSSGNSPQEFIIQNSTISGNNSQGILVQGIADTKQTFIIDNNTINSSNGQGMLVQASGNSQQQFNLSHNTVTNSTFEGILLQANDNAQISFANVQLNILKDNNTPGFTASMNSTQNLCLALNGNNSNTGFQLQQSNGTFQVVNLDSVNANNTGTITPQGNFVNVPVCP